jgi:hypothetical protein
VGAIRLVADRKAKSPEHISARPAVQRGGGTADKVVTLGDLFVSTKNFRGKPTVRTPATRKSERGSAKNDCQS